MRTIICFVNEIGALDFFVPVLRKITDKHFDVVFYLIGPKYVINTIKKTRKNWVLLPLEAHDKFIDLITNIYRAKNSISGIICSATSSFLEWTISEFAKENQIPIIHFVDTFYGYQKRFICGDLTIATENILLIDDIAKNEAICEGVEEKKIKIVGHPGWETQLVNFSNNNEFKCDEGNHNTIFLGAPIARDYGESLGFNETDVWRLVLEAKEERADLITNLIYCPHPQQTLDINRISAPVRPFHIELLKDYTQIFGIFSSPLMVAHLCGKISVSIQPGNRETDICPFSRRGFFKKASDKLELLGTILTRKKLMNCDRAQDALYNSLSRTVQNVERHFFNR